jgi:hypothetical protein
MGEESEDEADLEQNIMESEDEEEEIVKQETQADPELSK